MHKLALFLVLISNTWGQHIPQVIHPIPDQVANARNVYDYTFDSNSIFNESLRLLITIQGPNRDWISLENYILTYNILFQDLVQDIIIQNQLIYVANGKSGIKILNLSLAPSSSSSSPESIISSLIESGNYDSLNNAVQLFLQDSLLFIADTLSLQILNVSNPILPKYIGSYPSEIKSITSVTIFENIAYIIDTTMLHRIDVQNPFFPRSTGSFFIPGLGTKVIVTSNLIAIASSNGFYTYNLNQLTPYLLNQYFFGMIRLQNTPRVSEGMIYIPEINSYTNWYGFEIYNANNSSDVKLASRFTLPAYPMGIYVFNKIAFPYWAAALQLVNVSNSTNPVSLSTLSFSGYLAYIYGITVVGTQMFIAGCVCYGADTSSVLLVWSISNPRSPIQQAKVPTQGSVGDIAAVDNLVYVAERSPWNGIEIFNVSTPNSPKLIGEFQARGQVYGVTFANNTIIYVNERTQWVGFEIVDVHNSTSPQLVGQYSTSSDIQSLVVVNTIAYLSFQDSIQLLDISNPIAPILIGVYSVSSMYMSVDNQLLYAFPGSSTQNMSVLILNVSNSANLPIGSYPSEKSVYDFVLSSSIGYLATGSGFQILNLTNPSQPSLISSYSSLTSYQSINVKYSIAYLAAGDKLEFVYLANLSNPISLISPQTSTNTILSIDLAPALYLTEGVSGIQIFDLVSKNRLIGLPSLLNLGDRYQITVHGIDNQARSVVNDTFQLSIAEFPVLAQPIIPPNAFWSNKPILFIIPFTTFVDPDQGILVYNTSLTDRTPLPSWLSFNSQNLTYFGIAPEVDQAKTWSIQITATNTLGGYLSANFLLIVQPNLPPSIANQISTQIATVGELFKFVVPENTFVDVEGDHLVYEAQQFDGTSLPAWLSLKGSIFSGTPGLRDTGWYSTLTLSIQLTARDEKFSSSTTFIINVGGTSVGSIFLKVAAPILTILSAAFGLYRQRAWCLNRYKPQRYQMSPDTAIVGEPYSRRLETPSNEIVRVQAKLSRTTTSQCVRFFAGPRVHLPGGQLLPEWLFYHAASNSLRSRLGPELEDVDDLVIQVKDEVGLIREQFILHVQTRELGSPSIESEKESGRLDSSLNIELENVAKKES